MPACQSNSSLDAVAQTDRPADQIQERGVAYASAPSPSGPMIAAAVMSRSIGADARHAKCIYGQDEAARRRTEAALRDDVPG